VTFSDLQIAWMAWQKGARLRTNHRHWRIGCSSQMTMIDEKPHLARRW